MENPQQQQPQQVVVPLRFTPLGVQVLLECLDLGARGRTDALVRDIHAQIQAWQAEQANAAEKQARARRAAPTNGAPTSPPPALDLPAGPIAMEGPPAKRGRGRPRKHPLPVQQLPVDAVRTAPRQAPF